MGQPKSFIDVLEEQLRTDLRREIEAEVRAELKRKEAPAPAATAKAGIFETWLATNVTRMGFAPRKSTYKTTAPRRASEVRSDAATANTSRFATAAAAPAPRTEVRVRATTVEELCAVEILVRHSGSPLGSEFTESQLKSVWRRAALKSHPDRFASCETIVQMQKAALFRELASAYETLLLLFEEKLAA